MATVSVRGLNAPANIFKRQTQPQD